MTDFHLGLLLGGWTVAALFIIGQFVLLWLEGRHDRKARRK